MFGFNGSTDKVWKAYGRDDPYFGVLAHSEYSRYNLTDANIDALFKLGEADIAELFSLIEKSGMPVPRERGLDFGCGVGRLVVPLAKRLSEVAGVDVSEGMLAEATKNARRHGVNNVSFYVEIPDCTYDLIHSLFVFQHINQHRGENIIINQHRGENIIIRLWSKISAGGILAIQFPIAFRGKSYVPYLRLIRDALPRYK